MALVVEQLRNQEEVVLGIKLDLASLNKSYQEKCSEATAGSYRIKNLIQEKTLLKQSLASLQQKLDKQKKKVQTAV